MYDFCLARQKILGFLQDRLIKVSLFLQYGFQNKQDGNFILVNDVKRIPTEYEPPGTIHYFDESGAPSSTVILSHPYNNIVPNTDLQFTNTTVRCSSLGTNIYANPQQAQQQQAQQSAQSSTTSTVANPPQSPNIEELKEPVPQKPSTPATEQVVEKPSDTEPLTPPRPKLSSKEFNFLAKLMGVSEAKQQNTFKFSLGMDNL